MKKILLALLLAAGSGAFAQNMKGMPPDFRKIEKDAANPNSGLHLPKLMKRYLQGDSSMSQEERRTLYFGYSFSKDFNAFAVAGDYGDSLRTILETKEQPTERELRLLLRYADSVLKDQPFSLRTIIYQAGAYGDLGVTVERERCLHKMRIVFDAIFNTGDGKSKETAFYVIAVPHEYDVLDMLGFDYGGEQSLIEGHIDKLKLKENKYGIEALYFDVSRSMAGLFRLLDADGPAIEKILKEEKK